MGLAPTLRPVQELEERRNDPYSPPRILVPGVCFLYQTADSVFMGNHAEREEYVQEDAGIIYVGSTNRISMIGWNFGQVKGS